MKDITDKLHSMAQRLEAGGYVETSNMIDLLLEAETALNMCAPPETKTPNFQGYQLNDDGASACLYGDGKVAISGGDETITFDGPEIDLLIKALTNLRPMMGEQK